MDHSTRDKDADVDLESGISLAGDDSKKVSIPCTAKQGKTLFAKISGGFVGVSTKGEDRPSLCYNKSNLTGVPMDMMKVANKSLTWQESVDGAEKTAVKEKRKKAGNKKASKPPRPPKPPTLDAADQKLIREITELAMLKRARIERMKALKKMRAASAKPPSSHSNILAMVFTVVFCIVIIFQGMSSGKSPVASFHGSPLSAGEAEGGFISVQYQLNPSASDTNAPASESHNFVQQVAGSDLPEKLRRDTG